ncbi:MAG: hypothetical protein WC552_04800 [Candidatus Omnitrophota bacterium]
MLRRPRKNQSGIVLATVLIIVMGMIIIAISIVSINVSEVSTVTSLAQSITAEELAKMYYWQTYYNNALYPDGYTESVQIDGRTYDVSIDRSSPPNISIHVSY